MPSLFLQLFLVELISHAAALRQAHTHTHTLASRAAFPHTHWTCWQAFISSEMLNTHTYTHTGAVLAQWDLLTDILVIARVKLSCIWMQGLFLKAFFHTHCSTWTADVNLMLRWHSFNASTVDFLSSFERESIWSRSMRETRPKLATFHSRIKSKSKEKLFLGPVYKLWCYFRDDWGHLLSHSHYCNANGCQLYLTVTVIFTILQWKILVSWCIDTLNN